MISHVDTLLALRTQALTLSVCTTGSTSLSNTASAYVRAAGSFLTDGFRAGMEVTPAGFPATSRSTITNVTATVLTVGSTLTAAAAASGRTLTVGLPSQRLWENAKPDSQALNTPFVREQYLPGPAEKFTLGALGRVRGEPMYVLHVHCPENVGIGAPFAYADAVLELFAPTTALSLTNGDTVRVKTRPAPYRGALLNDGKGYALVPVTIPLWIDSSNPI